MKEIRFVLVVFGGIVLLGAYSVIAKALRIPVVVSIAVALVLPVAVMVRIVRDFTRTKREAAPARPLAKGVTFRVHFDDGEIVVLADDVPTERVAWADLLTVGITIEDQVFLTVPWWRLMARTAVASYPSHALGHAELLAELQRRLPGFDNAGVVRAMGMMDGGVVVWERPPAGAPAGSA